jgi:hypothetical protein
MAARSFTKRAKYIEALLALRQSISGSGITQLTADVAAGPGTGSVPATVLRIHGATVPAAGALTTKNVLQVSGVSTLSYGPVDLTSDSAVSGLLATAHQAPQTLAGDVTGTTAAATVVALQGHSVSAAAPTPGQELIFTGGVWTPTTPTPSVNGVKTLTQTISLGGTIRGGGGSATIVSTTVTAAAGQTFLIRGYAELTDPGGESAAGIWSIQVLIQVDGATVTGMLWNFTQAAGVTAWADMKVVEMVETGLAPGNHTFSILVISTQDLDFTTNSKIVVEQLIPSG